jgi:hypothetical protein
MSQPKTEEQTGSDPKYLASDTVDCRRAIKALFRSDPNADQPGHGGELWRYRGRFYVFLSGGRGMITAYRVGNDDRLRKLHRVPKALVEAWA